MAGRKPTTLDTRFWEKVDRRGDDECWPWTATCTPNGYGSFRINTKRKACAHRVALSLSGVPVPDDAVVMHRCDNPRCCNPSHLSVGTQSENIFDSVSKGRFSTGERNGQSKLSDDDAAAIRAARGVTGRQLAKAYGVSAALISLIRSGKVRAFQGAHTSG